MSDGIDFFAVRRQWLRQQELDKAAADARVQAAQTAARASLLPAIERGDVGAMRQFVELLAAHHSIAIEIRAEHEVAAFASGKHRIVVPPVVDARTFAIALHEIGHCLSEQCSGGDHQPDPTVTRWHHCVRCEILAWQKAFSLVPFSEQMFRELQHGLGSYRATTPAPRSAEQDADRLRSFVRTYATRKNARVLMAHREDLVNSWKNDAQDRRPRPGSLDYYREKLSQVI